MACLIHAEYTSTSLLVDLLLQPPVKGTGSYMVTVKVVKILDLIDANNPVLTGESLVHSVDSVALGGDLDTSDSIMAMSVGEKGSEVVVRHLVPGGGVSSNDSPRVSAYLHQAVLHGLGSAAVDPVLSIVGEEIALLDLIGPNAFSNAHHPEELVDVISRVAK